MGKGDMRQGVFSLICVALLGLLLVLHGGCQKEEPPMVSLGLDDEYLLVRMKALALEPAFTGEAYRWTLRKPSGEDTIVGQEQRHVFLFQEPGTYHATFEIIDPERSYRHEMTLVVRQEQVAFSPYISRVYEYCPAPGQFVNKLPEYKEGDTYETMLQKVNDCLARNNQQMISLGAYGGYVTFGFDHTVMNVPGEYDFKIDGNAFVAATHLDGTKPKGGSCEPGIVMVAFDWNQNGKPDPEEWYELAGSEYHKSTTLKGYSITYRRHDPNLPITPDPANAITNLTYIPWSDNQGADGYVHKNKFHHQSYWPQWLPESETTLTFSGTKLPNNAVDESGNGSYFVQYMLPWGYADNQPNGDDPGFDISWAVDANGDPVHLPGADFIRVYTGVNQYCGWLGETSTEVSGARDLHIHVKPVLPRGEIRKESKH